MQESTRAIAALLRFYDRLSAGDASAFDEVVSGDPAVLVVGTAPGEWKDRERLRLRFSGGGPRLEAGAPAAYEEESLAWAVDEPTFRFADGSVVRTRLTAVLHEEGGDWKLVHMHVSVGVPDAELPQFQERWLKESGERA